MPDPTNVPPLLAILGNHTDGRFTSSWLQSWYKTHFVEAGWYRIHSAVCRSTAWGAEFEF